MNDFTKNELQDIDCLIRHAKRNGLELISEKNIDDLENKINGMISNYCEHTNGYECVYCGIVACEDCKEPCGGELMDE